MFGFGKRGWRKVSGISGAQRKLSRKIGVPLSRAGRQRKLGAGCGCAVLLAALVGGLLAAAVALAGAR